MSWTDERVATLTKLWSQGKSASEIADVLGGVTRNAVIGKAHRLGLSGRPSPIKKKKITKAAPKKKVTDKTDKAAPKKKEIKPAKVAGQAKKEIKLPIAPPTFIEEKPVHDGELIGILDLTERVCRWPIGDPKEGKFGFCGAECDPAHPYCLPHMAMAFQASAKKEAKKMIKKATKENIDDQETDEEDIEDIDLENFDPDAIENDDDDLDDLDDDNEEITVATVAPTK